MADNRVAQLEAENARLRAELARLHGLEIEVSATRRKVRALYDHSFQFIGLLETDGTVLEINLTALRFVGITDSDVVGKPFWETPWWTHSPQEQARLRAAITSAQQGEFVRFETTHVGADGQTHTIDFSLKPVRNEQGQVVNLIPEGRDITDKRVTEQALQRALTDTEQRVASRTRELSAANEALSARLRELEESGAELRRLMNIIECTSDFVATARPDGGLLYVNRAGRELLGIGPEEDVSALDLPGIFSPWAQRVLRDQAIPTAVREGRWSGETAIVTRMGKEVHVSQVIMSHSGPSRELAYLSTIMRDITERRRNELFRESILNAIADPVFVKDDAHRFIALNQALCEFVGYPREAMLGKTDYDFFPVEEARAFHERDDAVLGSFTEDTSEEELTDAAGHVHAVSTRKTAFEDASGQRFLVGVIRDMTELKAAQRDLQNSVRFLNSIIENLPMCVKLVDSDGRLIEINPAGCSMLGSSDGVKLEGLELSSMVHADDREAFVRFNQSVCSGQRSTLRYRISDVVGRQHILESIAVPIPNPSGRGFLHLGLTRDMTAALEQERESKALEARLHESEKMEALGTLAGGIAHDFNNILTAILGFADLLHLRIRDSGSRTDVEQIRAAAFRARDLARQILTFSHRKEPELRAQRLQPVLHEALRLLRAAVPATIGIDDDIDPDCGPVMADATQIHQIMMNLGTNAYLAMRETGGSLRVELRELGPGDSAATAQGLPSGRYARLAVQDQGTGMPPEIASRIFEPYFTTRGKDGGAGLGLSVVHGIVKSHRGEIRVESIPGKGSTFLVYLPLAAQPDISAQLIGAEAIEGGRERVLVVDDDHAVAEWMQSALSHLGYSVKVCGDGEAALALFRSDPDAFDIVVSDVCMPRLAGDRMAVEMHASRPALPVLLCTAYYEGPIESAAVPPGSLTVLHKPIALKDLALAIRSALDRGEQSPG